MAPQPFRGGAPLLYAQLMRTALTLLIVCAAAGAQAPVSSSRWLCTDASVDGTTLRDQAGLLDAELSGPIRSGAKHIALDGTQNRLIVASKFDSKRLPATALTLEAWVRVDVPQDWGGIICCLEDNGADENGFILGYRGAQFMLGIATQKTGKITYLTGETRMRAGRWNHVVGTYDGKTMRLYVDGELDTESTAQSGPIKYKGTHQFALAGYLDANEYYGLTGRVHAIGISNEVASATDVQRRWRATRGKLASAAPDVEAPEPANAGWPGAMRDVRRSGVTSETLKLPLRREWSHQRSRPRSAWPPPAKGSFWQRLKDIKPRNVWDHAFHPVAVGDDVLYGSSELDTIHCLDARSGESRWTFLTGGPVRFAPHVVDNRVYVGSDDGLIYCLDRERGQLIWKRRLGPSDRLIPGNGRMISPWPVRTGLVAAQGIVYATCGLFPREGCWAVALNAQDGSEVWRTKVNASPQGYLLLSSRALFIPTGRGTPFALVRDSGTPLGAFGGPGGAYALVAGGTLVSGRGNKGELSVSDTFGRDQLAQFDGNRMVVTAAMSYLQSDTHLSALDRTRYLRLLRDIAQAKSEHGKTNRRYRTVTDALEKKQPLKGDDGKPLTKRALGKQKSSLRRSLLKLGARIDALESDLGKCVPWKVRAPHADALILAGKTLFAGGVGEVAAYDTRTGKKRWSHAVEGTALALAVANGRLLVGTSEGQVVAFGRGRARKPDHQLAILDTGSNPWLSTPGITLAVDPTAPIPAGPEGRRVESITSADLTRLPDRFANAVVIPSAGELTDEVKRIVRPWGGRVYVADSPEPIWTRGPLEGAGAWTHMYATPANTACSGDTLVGDDLQLQWFGGPGPNPMIDRHLRTTPPLFRDGRLLIPGHDRVIAVDGCNGTVLWEREVPGLSRTGAPYDGGHMAVGKEHLWIADGRFCRGLDLETGETAKSIAAGRPGSSTEWGWVCKTDDALFGSARHPGSAIKSHGRTELMRQYGEHQPLVTSHTVFRVGAWNYRGGALVNATFTLADGRIWFVEGKSKKVKAGGRVKLSDIFDNASVVCLDAKSGKEVWRVPFPETRIRHSIFLAVDDGHLVAVGGFTHEVVTKKADGTESKRLQTWYEVMCFGAGDGELRWRVDHSNNAAGSGGDHGEQVHHPVLRDGVLFVEPVAYHLDSGARWNPDGGDKPWFLGARRGCGTFSASASCLYFRNHNPMAMTIGSGAQQTKITEVSRPGCWISILPVGGMVLLPEASSGCVCAFPVQTSMGFVPRR